MAKWIMVLIILIAFPFAAYAQDNTRDKAVQAWVEQTFGIQIPNPEISQSWKSVPIISGCDYEWHINMNDARIQIKDGNDNYYRLSVQGNTVTVDFIKTFSGFFWG